MLYDNEDDSWPVTFLGLWDGSWYEELYRGLLLEGMMDVVERLVE